MEINFPICIHNFNYYSLNCHLKLVKALRQTTSSARSEDFSSFKVCQKFFAQKLAVFGTLKSSSQRFQQTLDLNLFAHSVHRRHLRSQRLSHLSQTSLARLFFSQQH